MSARQKMTMTLDKVKNRQSKIAKSNYLVKKVDENITSRKCKKKSRKSQEKAVRGGPSQFWNKQLGDAKCLRRRRKLKG